MIFRIHVLHRYFTRNYFHFRFPILRISIRGVPSQGGTGLDTYQTCIQARFDTYQFPMKRAPNATFRLTHVRERKLAVPPLRLFRNSDISGHGQKPIFLHAPFLKEIPFFSCKETPSRPLLKPQPLQVELPFPLRGRVVWGCQKEGVLGKKMAWPGWSGQGE